MTANLLGPTERSLATTADPDTFPYGRPDGDGLRLHATDSTPCPACSTTTIDVQGRLDCPACRWTDPR